MKKRLKKGLSFRRLLAGAGSLLAGSALLPGVARADVFSSVPESADYTMVYTLPVPATGNYNTTALPYSVDNSATISAGTFDRVAYFLELGGSSTSPNNPNGYVYASFDRPVVFVDGGDLGVPSNATNGSGIATNTALTNLNVFSNVAGVTVGSGLAGGKLEFWPSNYGQGANGAFDHDDDGFNTASGYGSMQIHNTAVPQTLLAYNAWGTGSTANIGIGNRPSGDPDWTFANNTGDYTTRNLQVLVRLTTSAQSGANYEVNTTDDHNDGFCGVEDCTLREAINAANANADTSIISFDATAFATAQIIQLTGVLPDLSSDLTINGPAVGVTIRRDTGGNYRILNVLNGKTVALNRLTITNGLTSEEGAGLYNFGTVTLTDCTISSNRTSSYGGGLRNNSNRMTLIGCTVTGNSATGVGGGGGIDSDAGSSLILTNCTFSGNSANNGGGGALWTFTPTTITNCTFSGNSANASGSVGGIAGNAVTIGNSIVAGNTGTSDAFPDVAGTFTSNGYNLIGAVDGSTGFTGTGDQTGTTAAPLDPKLDSLDDNGGTTQTMALQSDSPAIDAGNSSLTTDQRGAPRPYDIVAIPNASGGNGADIGAFEFDPPQSGANFVVNTTDDTDDGVCGLSHCSLREAIDAANGDGADSEITFDVTVFATQQTITLGGTEFGIGSDGTLLITPPAAGLILDGDAKSRIFNVAADANLTFSGLSLRNGDAGGDNGGAINSQGTLTISRSTFSDNAAHGSGQLGGAIMSNHGTLVVDRSTFTGNKADGIGGLGGALYNFRSSVTITECTFSGNSAGALGGVLFTQGLEAVTTITGSTLSGNSSFNGGAIDHGTGAMTITNCTLANNTADSTSGQGGAIANYASLTLRNCTFSGNSASEGGAIHNQGTLTVGNTLFKAGATGQNLSNTGTINSLGYNLSDDGTGPNDGTTDRLNTDPLLDTNGLQSNGGPTQTIALQANSPAIDKGKALGGVTTDQRGRSRPQDQPDISNASGGGGSDIGAYEVDLTQSGSSLVVNTTDDFDDGTCGAAHCSLREAINAANSNSDASTITFSSLFNSAQTITVSNSLPTITQVTTIAGPGARLLTVTETGAGGTIYVFTVNGGISATLSGLTISNGLNGIANSGNLTATHCTLSGNSNGISNDGTVNLANCTVSDNDDGIYNFGTVNLANCTLSGNGNGIYTGGGTVDVTNCTLSGNTNNGISHAGGTATLKNSICAGNANNTLGTITDGGSNILTGTATDAGLDPAGLQDNGGPTQTIALLSGSPAINSGSNALVPADFGDVDGDTNTGEPVPFDQRGPGFKRIRGGTVDKGAYEVPTLDVAKTTVTEGNAGTTTLNFVIKLADISATPVSVTYQTGDSATLPATAGTDYVAVPATTVTFAPGETTKTVPVTVNGDTTDEANEHIALVLSNPQGAVIGTVNDGIILDDDPAPNLSISDAQVNETNGGTAQMVFTLTLSSTSDQIVTVVANTNSSGGAPTATPGMDYLAQVNKVVTFAPGQTTQTLNVSVLGDLLNEGDEKFGVRLTNGLNCTVIDNSAVGIILDNDPLPTVSASAGRVTEGDADTSILSFTVKLSAASGRNVSVRYKTTTAAQFPASAGSDYVAISQTTLTFAPGETSKTVDVTINGDIVDEVNERVTLAFDNAINVALGAVSEGVIMDDDATPGLSIADVSTTEGNTGTKVLTFTITLSSANGQTVTVSAATGSGGSPGSTPGSDYVAMAPTTLTFAPGETSKQIHITINGDTTVEQNEKFGVVLSGVTGAILTDNTAIGTILNDDAALTAPLTAPSP